MDPLRQYQDARQSCDRSESTLREIGERFGRIANALGEATIRITTPTPTKYPEVILRNSHHFTPEELPTFEALEKALVEHYDAEIALNRIESQLSAEDRRTVGRA